MRRCFTLWKVTAYGPTRLRPKIRLTIQKPYKRTIETQRIVIFSTAFLFCIRSCRCRKNC